MKKLLFIPSILITTIPVFSIVSCSSSSSDYYKMPWSIDNTKVNELKNGDWQTFNSEATSLDKLKKVIKGDGEYIDKYTKEAFDKGWFSSIKFEINSKGQPSNLIIELKDKQTIDSKEVKNPYRLPNGKLKLSY